MFKKLTRDELKADLNRMSLSEKGFLSLRRKKNLKELNGDFKTSDTSFSVSDTLKDSYQYWLSEWKHLIQEPRWGANLLSGLTVAAVALPLNVALAIAAGLPASAGLVAGAVGGGLAALLGGSRFQVTGPAAALNTMVFAIVYQHGIAAAAAVALIVGLIQIVLSSASAGSLMRFVPESVLLGFTSAVGIKLLDSQMPKLFGIEWTFHEMLTTLSNPVWLHEVTWSAVVCGLLVSFLVIACKVFPRVPAALLGIALTTYLAYFLDWSIIRVGEIPPINFQFTIPHFSMNVWFDLIQLALPLALLAAAESILSAQAIDRMSGDRHHSNLEIFGQGIGNIFTGLVGGMPVSGVIVRSSVNLQSGAKNRLGALFHALILLSSVIYLGSMISIIPLASLAGLLCVIGFRLIEFSEFIHLIRHNRVQALGFSAALLGTVTNNIVLGLATGLIIVWLGTREKAPKADAQRPAKHTEDDSNKESEDHHKVFQLSDRDERWIQHLKENASVPQSAFVHPNSSVIGRVVLGRNVHIAAEASVRADEGTPFYIGDNSNVQDGVVIHALKKKWIRIRDEKWAVYIGSGVSLAHHALVHGPCYIGDNTFVGFKAVVHDSIVGKGCYIGMGAIVVGVEVPDDRYVPHGAVIDSKEKVQSLGKANHQHRHFNDDVVEVNRGLAEAYKELSYEKST